MRYDPDHGEPNHDQTGHPCHVPERWTGKPMTPLTWADKTAIHRLYHMREQGIGDLLDDQITFLHYCERLETLSPNERKRFNDILKLVL